jgi:hypothetical protein
MQDTNRTSADTASVAIAALTALSSLLESLIEMKILSSEQACTLLEKAAERNEQSATQTSGSSNAKAAALLRELKASFRKS